MAATLTLQQTTAPGDAVSAFAQQVEIVCGEIASMLISKNLAYGNSALDPLRCFSKADAVEQIKVRIDDKLSRLMRGRDAGEDTITDLIGYLVLLKIAKKGG
jgi:hypothetical protein